MTSEEFRGNKSIKFYEHYLQTQKKLGGETIQSGIFVRTSCSNGERSHLIQNQLLRSNGEHRRT